MKERAERPKHRKAFFNDHWSEANHYSKEPMEVSRINYSKPDEGQIVLGFPIHYS